MKRFSFYSRCVLLVLLASCFIFYGCDWPWGEEPPETPVTPSMPSAPSDLTALALSSSSVQITWQDNSTTEELFILEYSKSANFAQKTEVTLASNVTEAIVSGLEAATLYYFRLLARNSDGDSAYTGAVSVTTNNVPITPPIAPSNPTAAVTSQTVITVSWQDNSDNEESFILEYSKTSDFAQKTDVTLGANTTTAAVSSLESATLYYFRVFARNSIGDSAYTAVVSETTSDAPITLPDAPSNLTVSASSDTAIDASWQDNSDNEVSFILEYSKTSDFAQKTEVSLGANQTATTVGGLDAATLYYFRLLARNSAGDSAYTSVVSETTDAAPVTPPDSPDNVILTVLSSSSITITWDDNSDNEEAFVIEYDSASDFSSMIQATVAEDVEELTVDSLTPSTLYYFRVKASNSVGDSDYTATASATTNAAPVTIPTEPSAVTATAQSSSSVGVTWSDDSDNEEHFILGYSTSSDFSVSTEIELAADVTEYTVTGLTAATTYYFRVKARNSAGDSIYTAGVSATTLELPPTAPSGLSVSVVSSSSITASWTDNSDNEVNFVLEYDSDSGFASPAEITLSTDVTTHTVSSLSPGTRYYFRIKAVNSSGPSAWSNTDDGTTLGVPVGSFSINNGSTYSTSTTLTLTQSITNAIQMRFQEAGQSWTDWETYSSTKSFNLSNSTNGTRQVNAEFRNSSGDVTAKSDTIILDTVGPTASIRINSNATYSNSQSVTLTISGSDATSGLYSVMYLRNSTSSSYYSYSYSTSMSWALATGSDGTRTVYLRLRDRAGNTTTVSDSITLDTTPPTVNIRIDGGNTYTWSRYVTLNISASDSLSGRRSTIYLGNSSTSLTAASYATSKSWTLTSGDGYKYVYIKVYDNAGNSRVVYDSIYMDTTPIISFSINNGASSTYKTGVTLYSSVRGASYMRFRNYGSSTWSSWYTYSSTKSWNLLSGSDGARYVYVEYMDNRGRTYSGGRYDYIALDAIRRLRFTSRYIYVYDDADNIGDGEIRWHLYLYDTGGTLRTIHRKTSTTSIGDGETYNYVDISTIISMSNVPGESYRVHFQLVDEDTVSNEYNYATPQYFYRDSGWGVGDRSIRTDYNEDPDGRIYYRVEVVD